MLFIDDKEYQSPDKNLDNPPLINTEHDLAYIIYTSGTTGNPKGVMIEHHSLSNYCNWNNHAYEVSSNDRVTKYANYGFDVSIWEMAPYLIAGAIIFVIPEHLLFEMKLSYIRQLISYVTSS